MGEGVEALLVGAVLAHVTFLTTLHTSWPSFLTAPPALSWFGVVKSLVTFLSAVVALIQLRAVIPDMALRKVNVQEIS